MAKKPNTKTSLVIPILFALMCLGGGITMVKSTVKSLLLWQQVQSWVETPCQILDAELKTSSIGDGDTYWAAARYKYSWTNQVYECNKVAIINDSDNLSNYHQSRVNELQSYLKNNKPFRCFVNPDRPSQAILYRELRTEMLWVRCSFCLIFCFAGISMIAYALWEWKRISHRQKLQQQQPNEPWLWRDNWSRGLITQTRWAPVVHVGLFTLLWNLISWPIGIGFASGDGERPGWVIGISIGFPLLGLCMLGYTIYLITKTLRWEISQLQLATFPGVVGGKLSGVIHAPAALSPADSFLLTLTCFVERTRRTNNGNKTYLDPTWQEDISITQTLSDSPNAKTTIPVSFYIPYQCLPTDDEAGYSWQLEAQAEMPGLDYQATFEIPVFKTADSSPDPPPEDDGLLANYQSPVPFETLLRRAGGRLLHQSPSRYEVEFHMGRNLGLTISTAIFTVIWTGITAGLVLSDSSLFAKIAFSSSCVVLLGFAAWLWLDKNTLSFSDDGIQQQGGILGIGRRHQYKSAEIKSITTEASKLYFGNTTYQQIVLETHNGKKQKLVGRIARRADADRLAETIRQTLGLAYPAKASAPIVD